MEHDHRQEGEQEETSPFYRALKKVGERPLFSFQDLLPVPTIPLRRQQPGVVGRNNVRWTMDQSRAVFDALMMNHKKTITRFSVHLEMCRPEAVALFVECIRSIQSLNTLVVRYNPYFLKQSGDPKDLQRTYKNELDSIFRALLQNPSITKLDTTCQGAAPEAIFELLSQTLSLADFRLATDDYVTDYHHVDMVEPTVQQEEYNDPNYDMALHIEAGFRQNTSLQRVHLSMSNSKGNLGMMISGLNGHASLKDLSVRYRHHDVHVFAAVTMVLRTTPLLEKLEIYQEEVAGLQDYDSKVNVDRVLIGLSRPSLFQPLGAGLKTLVLNGVPIGLGKGELATASTSLVVVNKVNTILEKLTLVGVVFVGRNAVSVLWHMTGLRFLNIRRVRYEDFPDDTTQKAGNDEQVSSGWKTLIDRNPKLEPVSTEDVNSSCFKGVVEGSCNLERLQCLEHTGKPVIDLRRGTLFQGLFQKTKSLKHLHLKSTRLTDAGVNQLAPGLSANTTIETLDLTGTPMEENMYTTIIGILIVNKTLTRVHLGRLKGVDYHEYSGCFRHALLSMARLNTTVVHLDLSHVGFGNNAMGEFLGGFSHQNKLKVLDLSLAGLCDEGLVALGRGLERENIFLTDVKLPRSLLDYNEAVKEFIESLKCVPRRITVTFPSRMDGPGLLESLLQAAKENKNLIGYGDLHCGQDMDHYHLYREIELYLKLNRCGRCLFGSPSMSASLWPVILAPLAATCTTSTNKEEEDSTADALFYALREYFMSCCNSGQAEPPPPTEGSSSRPKKRARTGL